MWMIETATLSNRFVEPVKIGNSRYMRMFDGSNVVLSHPRKDCVRMSVLDVLMKEHKEGGKFFDEGGTKEHIREEHDYLNRVKIISTNRTRILRKMGMKKNAEITYYSIKEKLIK